MVAPILSLNCSKSLPKLQTTCSLKVNVSIKHLKYIHKLSLITHWHSSNYLLTYLNISFSLLKLTIFVIIFRKRLPAKRTKSLTTMKPLELTLVCWSVVCTSLFPMSTLQRITTKRASSGFKNKQLWPVRRINHTCIDCGINYVRTRAHLKALSSNLGTIVRGHAWPFRHAFVTEARALLVVNTEGGGITCVGNFLEALLMIMTRHRP